MKIETVQILGQQKLFQLNENNKIQVSLEFVPNQSSGVLVCNSIRTDLDSLRFYFRLTGIDGRANPNGEKQMAMNFHKNRWAATAVACRLVEAPDSNKNIRFDSA